MSFVAKNWWILLLVLMLLLIIGIILFMVWRNNEKFKKTTKWLYENIFKFEHEDVLHKSDADKVIASMKTTAISRYNASIRLDWQGRIAFLTTTTLSLGLIFIPLVQLSGVELKLTSSVLSSVQIFMAVAILVYSVIIGTAKYESRCENFNDCGNKIKNLIRKLRREMMGGVSPDKEFLEKVQRQYALILDNVENHERCDYSLTILRERDLYKISLFCRIKHNTIRFWSLVLNYSPNVLLLLSEILIITDMFGITNYFSFLQKAAS